MATDHHVGKRNLDLALAALAAKDNDNQVTINGLYFKPSSLRKVVDGTQIMYSM